MTVAIPLPAAGVAGGSGSSQILRELSRRRRLCLSWIDTAVLAMYSVVVCVATTHHEPWADEAQAWQIARSFSFYDLLFKYLHYEAHPALWYVLLRFLHLAGVSYNGMHWVCAGIGILATWLLLAFSPFPQYLRALLPFTCFLVFQYVVVARSYVLVPLLLYLIAWQWKKGILRVSFLLGLLANVEPHVAGIAIGLAVILAIEQIRAGVLKSRDSLRRFLFGSAFFVTLLGAAVAITWPAPDWSFWHVLGPRPSLLVSILVIFGRLMLVGICHYKYAAFAFLIVACLWLKPRGSVFLLPFAALLAISSIGNDLNVWHAGLINPLLVAVTWISWPPPENTHTRIERLAPLAWACIAVVQILYAAHALRYDYSGDFSGDPAAAAFLKPYVLRGDRILTAGTSLGVDASFHAVGMLPYFDHLIYANWNQPFWWWSMNNNVEKPIDALLDLRPDLIVFEAQVNTDGSDPRLQALAKAGYRVTNRFCGAQPVLFTFFEENCHLILMREPGNGAASNLRQDAH